jgi:hypothetical protein
VFIAVHAAVPTDDEVTADMNEMAADGDVLVPGSRRRSCRP